jgi:GNAT superfamily N-acetyltransferase
MSYSIRQATIDEAAIVGDHRRAMFSDMRSGDDAALDAMSAKFLPWLLPRMESGEYLAWFAVAADGSVAAGLGLWLMDWPPHMIGPGSRRGNILNVYTEPAHRRQGLARALMLTALDWCRANGIRSVILHASNDGRAIYESLGFKPTNEMRLTLDTA